VSDGATPRPATVAVNLGGGALVPQVQEVLGDGEVVVSIDDERVRDAEILLVLSRDRETMEPSAVPSVRWLHAFATGVDSYPLDVIGDRIFTCSRGANAVAIAEFVLATMLAFVKRLPETWLTEAPENWGVAQLDVLAGRTVGLLGVGAIGTEVAKRAAAFDMRVVAYRRRAVAHEMSQIELLPTLQDLLGACDHLVIAAPATPDTHHIINATTLAAAKPGMHLVNIARGSLVDQDALLAALDDGRVACASLDTVDPEPLPAGHWFYEHPKVRMTAHVSWYTPQMQAAAVDILVDNVGRYLRGEPLLHVVDPVEGY